MKKILSLFAAVLFAGSMFAEGLLFEQTYPGTPSEFVSSYSKTFTLASGNDTLTYANVNNGKSSDNWDAVRAGSKNNASAATITSQAIAAKVSKVVISFTQVDAAKTNALYLQVAATADFAEATKINAAIAAGEVAFEIAAPAENKFYQIVIDQAQGSANGFNRWNKIQFISPDGGTPIVPTTYDTLSVAQAKDTANALADNATSKQFYVEGYAVNVADYNVYNNNQTFYLVDDAAAPDSLFQAYLAVPQKDGKAYKVLAGDKLRLFGQLKKYVNKSFTQLEILNPSVEFLEEVEGDRTIVEPSIDTITVARALAIGDSIGQGKTTAGKYVIEGFVTALTDNKGVPNKDGGWADYKNQCMWVADTYDQTAVTKETAFFVYQGVAPEQVTKGAKIQFTCAIKNYNGMIETAASKGAITILQKGEDPDTTVVPLDTISVARALEIGQALASGAVSAKEYVIKGYVSSIQEYFTDKYKNETFFITDTKGDRTSDKTKAFEVYQGKPNTQKEIGLDALIQIKCKIKNYNNTIENDGVNLPFEVLEQGKPVIVDTVSVAEAMEIGNALADNAYTDNPYVVVGYVTKAYDPDEGKTKQNFYMADDPDERGEFYAYRANPDSKIKDGDYVQLFGKIQKYVGSKGTTIELSYGQAKHVEAPKLDTLTVAEVQALDLAEEATTVERFVVIGYVAAITADFEEDLQSFNLSDDATATTGEFACLDAFIAEPGANLHDQVKIIGKIQKLNGAFRMVSGKATVLNGQGIENIVLTEKAQKVMMDGVVYIIRDNKIFNLQGTQVR